MNNQKNNGEFPINFINDQDKIIIYADLCGINKKDIEIELQGKVLMIKGHREFGIANGFTSAEILTGSLCKMIELNDEINKKEIVAEHNNGLLKITMPKVVNPESHVIEIK